MSLIFFDVLGNIVLNSEIAIIVKKAIKEAVKIEIILIGFLFCYLIPQI